MSTFALPEKQQGKKLPFVILDAGHGGLNPANGHYTTAPSKMWEFKNWTFYEGVFNRLVVKEIAVLLDAMGIPYEIVSHKWQDNSRPDRVAKVQNIVRRQGNSVLFSIHANAANTNNPNFFHAKGYMVFTSKGQTKSDAIAETLWQKLQKHLPTRQGRKDLSDGDLDYEASFDMLALTPCPAVLLECGFFTNEEEALFLMQPATQKAIATAIVETIVTL